VLRASFVHNRLGHRPEQLEAMDLTRFMHGGPARLLGCERCGALMRDERETAQYESDLYDSALMKHLYPRYLRAFEEKRPQYQPLLGNRAEILEVGSHLGAFLEASENWGWRPTGLDIGESTSRFARQQGGSVKRVALEDYSPGSRPDAIFIWNCFEQLDDPSAALTSSRQLLGRHGLLVIRVPNANFYLRQRSQLGGSSRTLKMLGYNNLLGFPYLHGYNRRRLSVCYGPTDLSRLALIAAAYLRLPIRIFHGRCGPSGMKRDGKGSARRRITALGLNSSVDASPTRRPSLAVLLKIDCCAAVSGSRRHQTHGPICSMVCRCRYQHGLCPKCGISASTQSSITGVPIEYSTWL